MSIRFKVIFPYLLLTLIIAIMGVYVVTKLVANSLTDRLTNQLLESGRVVSDGMARQEIKHIQAARIIAFTKGVGLALQSNDAVTLSTLTKPIAGGLAAENMMLINMQGQEMMQLVSSQTQDFANVSGENASGSWPFVQTLLKRNDAQSVPERSIILNPHNQLYYYYSAMPVSVDNKMVGVIVVGTSLNTLLPTLKSISLADLTFYDKDGHAIATTLEGGQNDPKFLASLAITPDLYEKISTTDGVVSGENFSADGRGYSLARGSLKVSNDKLGVFGVLLPLDFVIASDELSRNTYVGMFTLAMLAVILVGYGISRLIITPLYSLMRTSQAITDGDLTQRTGVHSKDEIGTLANTFDEMTQRLQERSAELERANAILEQMDKTKENFISISAHELRTPLTLIQGYSQMMQTQTDKNPSLAPIVKGLVDGSERMLEVVNSMLDVTRIDGKMLKPMLDKVQISLVVMRAQKTFKAAFKERNLTLITDGLDQVPVILADADLIYKVFYHLMMNAIKYTQDGGQITISGRAVNDNLEKPEIEVVISDTGIGIDKEHHELVFEKFYQTGELHLHSSGRTKFKGGGPGLGLAIARGILEAHDGRIWVESAGHDEKAHLGSQFYIRLPITGPAER